MLMLLPVVQWNTQFSDTQDIDPDKTLHYLCKSMAIKILTEIFKKFTFTLYNGFFIKA